MPEANSCFLISALGKQNAFRTMAAACSILCVNLIIVSDQSQMHDSP